MWKCVSKQFCRLAGASNTDLPAHTSGAQHVRGPRSNREMGQKSPREPQTERGPGLQQELGSATFHQRGARELTVEELSPGSQ